MHSYLNYEGAFYADGNTNLCTNARGSCGVALASAFATAIGIYYSEVHGWNHKTGGSDYAIVEFATVLT